MEILQGVVRFGISIPLDDFTCLVAKHLRENPDTPDLEEQGKSLVNADFSEDNTYKFVRDVCKWGGYRGVGERILKRN